MCNPPCRTPLDSACCLFPTKEHTQISVTCRRCETVQCSMFVFWMYFFSPFYREIFFHISSTDYIAEYYNCFTSLLWQFLALGERIVSLRSCAMSPLSLRIEFLLSSSGLEEWYSLRYREFGRLRCLQWGWVEDGSRSTDGTGCLWIVGSIHGQSLFCKRALWEEYPLQQRLDLHIGTWHVYLHRYVDIPIYDRIT